MEKKWVILNKKHEGMDYDYQKIAKTYKINPYVAKAIVNRGITDFSEYLGSGQFHSAVYMKDMTKGVLLVKGMIERKERIKVIADYDIDGVNAGYILYQGLRECGADVSVKIPHRIKDGYGISKKIVEDTYNEGIHNLITCDNGIAALDAIHEAKTLGMTVVVTDHHAIPYEDTPDGRVFLKSEADAIIDPHQQECHYPFKELCGAAVAWKFIIMLYKVFHIPEQKAYDQFLENVAFATVGDVMDLKGENRTIVKLGLKALGKTKNPGLRALIGAKQLYGKELKAYHIGFVLGPCINAAGRLDTAETAFQLLCAKTDEEAERIAQQLVIENQQRQELTAEGLKKALEIAEEYKSDKILVIYLPECHESIAGIIAGKVRERWYRPVFVLTDGEACVKGSGRSIAEYNMFEEMNKVADVFLGFGGHPMAAGLSLEKEKIHEFRTRINEACALTDEDIREKVRIDAVVPVSLTSREFIFQVNVMEPFGKGNSKPVFADRNLLVEKISVIGKDKDSVKMFLSDGNGFTIEGVMFSRKNELFQFLRKKYGDAEVDALLSGANSKITISVTYDMDINEYKGKTTPQIIIKDFC